MNLGLFGGSFSPIHNGHVRIALAAAADWNLEKVFVIPAKVSPFKTATPPWPDDLRMRLVRLACAPHPILEPSSVDLDRGGEASYAIDTVRHFHALYPSARLFFIIGEDALPGLPRWKDYPGLTRLAKFVAYPRTFESSTEIRRILATNGDITPLVPPAVAAAIPPGIA